MLPIKLLVLDVDGTLTDGKIYMGEQGEVFKAFNAHDAQGIRKLPSFGITPVILTGRVSQIVFNRAKEMGISEIYQDVINKKKKLDELLSVYQVTYQEIGYIGDDENDLEAMQECYFKACPLNAVPKIKEMVGAEPV